MEKHAVSRLIGAPPGYIGYDEGGQLTEAVRRKPYSVILFDEIEKAHADVFNILLQILDDGRVTDSHGRTVNFKNTIIIMTSNIGSQQITERLSAGYGEVHATALAELRNHFRPEFLNRVNEIVVFQQLSRTDIVAITGIQLARFAGRLADRRITLQVRDEAKELIGKMGYDPVYGARPLKRVIQRSLETPVSRMLISGDLKDGQVLQVAVGADGELQLRGK